MGQEAISVGVCAALGDASQVLSSYRSHASFLAKTRNPDLFFAELYGKASGTAAGKSGSMHLTIPEQGFLGASGIVGSGIPIALGAGFANKKQRTGKLVAVFFGDGAIDEGVFWESLNVACLMKIPVLLVCEDNGLAVHTSTGQRRGFGSITEIVRNFKTVVKDLYTTDVESIYSATSEAILQMQEMDSPAFMNARCCRYLEHVGTGTDFDQGYRQKKEFEEWFRKDPVRLQRDRLLQLGFSEKEIASLERETDAKIEASIAKAKAAPFPLPEELYRGVYYEND
jgi:pyruvate dehydrogenase E1 component alpha subunit